MKGLFFVAVLSTIAMAVSGRGGVFNRFSPEILANLGYGGGQGHSGMYHRAQPFFETDNMIEEEPFSMDMKKPCYGKACTSNDYCCPGTVCDWDGTYGGRCVFVRGSRLGEVCRRDNDCDAGLICGVTTRSLGGVCSIPLKTKQYSEDCESSSDCDISRGLCCQLLRRHRQTHRKACAFFKNPLICIGNVGTGDQVLGEVNLSGAEKRLTD